VAVVTRGARWRRPTLDHVLDFSSWRFPPWLLYGVPVLVWYAVPRVSENMLKDVAMGIVGLGALLVVRSYASFALVSLTPILIFQQPVLAFALKHGVPVEIVRPLASVKELIVFALLVTALETIRKEGHRFDRLDWLAIAFVGLVTLYVLVPAIAGQYAPRAWDVRTQGWRANALFIVVMFAARHIPIDARIQQRVANAALKSGLIFGGIAVYEWLDSSGWNNFAINTLGVANYQHVMFGAPLTRDIRLRSMIGTELVTRPGSLLYSGLEAGLYMLVAFSLAAALIARARRRSTTAYIGVGVLALAIIATNTRAAELGMIVAGAAALSVGPALSRRLRGDSPGRVKLAIAAGTIVILLVPVAAASGAIERFFHDDDGSAQVHEDTTKGGWSRAINYPMGIGVGTSAGVGTRYDVGSRLVEHNAYLQIANETGLISLALYVALLLTLLLTLRRLATLPGISGAIALGAMAAGIALAFAGFFQHTWVVSISALNYWSIAGTAANVRASTREVAGSSAPPAELSPSRP